MATGVWRARCSPHMGGGRVGRDCWASVTAIGEHHPHSGMGLPPWLPFHVPSSLEIPLQTCPEGGFTNLAISQSSQINRIQPIVYYNLQCFLLRPQTPSVLRTLCGIILFPFLLNFCFPGLSGYLDFVFFLINFFLASGVTQL